MKLLKEETAYNGYYKLKKLTFDFEGETITRELFDRGNGTAALVFDTVRQEYVLVKQFRIGAMEDLLEVVAGSVQGGRKEAEEIIEKEIEEEIGYAVDKLTFIQEFYPSPGACSEIIYLFYAEVSRQTSSGGGLEEEHENIEVVYVPKKELKFSEIHDAKTLIALMWAQQQEQL
ncbi:MAG: NUDIX domain-containing protein [Hymenobacteraceae bacterium]|nr:NUDIX domain-containing protein [Hymenobacteraceae bacterium]MDX5397361.1 NUDIX domain-containing protein [Hymenobacteraceae bacterium]MDX5443748.1 NUDIX domain-containing protein [Hymenobacteraceae bacterium]MDX5513441.1 NUDIX domain-containing protein [Hymenobacteraceae bacterium]